MEVDSMNNLLIFFAFPIATIIISAILQKILRCPIAVASFSFAVFIIVTFSAFDETFLIATLAYTIIALITACVVQLICRNQNTDNQDLCDRLQRIVSNLSNSNNDENSNCSCGCNNRYRSYRYRKF